MNLGAIRELEHRPGARGRRAQRSQRDPSIVDLIQACNTTLKSCFNKVMCNFLSQQLRQNYDRRRKCPSRGHFAGSESVCSPTKCVCVCVCQKAIVPKKRGDRVLPNFNETSGLCPQSDRCTILTKPRRRLTQASPGQLNSSNRSWTSNQSQREKVDFRS